MPLRDDVLTRYVATVILLIRQIVFPSKFWDAYLSEDTTCSRVY
jgi:hypothetical protein